MIQRIQTFWLFLAALTNAALFIAPLYEYNLPSPAPPTEAKAQLLQVTNFYPLMIIAAVITLLPVIAIFLYKNRKKQRRLVFGSILATLSFIAVMIMRISHIQRINPDLVSDQYMIPGPLLPVLSVVFMILAIRGISKDDKLVKSMDRFR